MDNITKFYYHRLNNEQKQIYRLICDGIGNLSSEIILPIISKNSLSLIYEAVLLDNPIFFYTVSFQYTSDFIRRRIIFNPFYNYPSSVIKQSADTLNNYLRLFDVVKYKSDVEKELYVHDYFLENFTYDYMLNEHSFSPLGLLVYKKGVCEGIAKFVKIMLNYLGVECMLVSGKGISTISQQAEQHMWNIVLINGNTYHLDVTFDMTQESKIKRYDYFNLPDVEINRDHVIISETPKCVTSGKDYYSANDLVFYDFLALEDYIRASLLNGKRHIVFKLNNSNMSIGLNVGEKIIGIALTQFQMLYKGVLTK